MRANYGSIRFLLIALLGIQVCIYGNSGIVYSAMSIQYCWVEQAGWVSWVWRREQIIWEFGGGWNQLRWEVYKFISLYSSIPFHILLEMALPLVAIQPAQCILPSA